LTLRKHGGLPQAKIGSASEGKQKRQTLKLLLGLVFVSGVVFTSPSSWYSLIVVALAGWVFASDPEIDYAIAHHLGNIAWTIYFLTPIVAGVAAYAGFSAAYIDLNDTRFNSTIKIDGGGRQEKAVLFRFTERGVVYRRESDKRIVFSPWDRISELDHPIEITNRSFFCRATTWLCPTENVQLNPKADKIREKYNDHEELSDPSMSE
jgi:hypothetical protein